MISSHHDVFHALHEIAVAAGGVLDPAALARLVAERARDLLEADAVGFYVCDPSAGVLYPLHSSDASVDSPEPVARAGVGAAGQAFLRGEPVAVADYAGWSHAAPWAAAQGVRAVVAVPLQVADRRIGAIAVRTYAPRNWTDQDVQTLTLLAAQVAPVLEAARQYETSERRARELDALYRAEAVLHRSLQRKEVLAGLVDVATEILQADKTTVLVWDQRHEALVVGAARGFRPETVARMRHGPGEGVTWLVGTLGQPITVEDAAADPRVAHHITEPEGICSLLHVPIVLAGEIAGVFGVNYCYPRTFNGDEERLLTALAQRAALALDNADLFERERLSRERLELALEAGNMGTWDWDIHTNRVTWSTHLEAIHGLQPGTFAGTFEAYLSDVHPDDLARVQQTIGESVARGAHHLEYRIVWPDGSLHWLEARGRLLRDANGQPAGMRGVCLDVTARKLADQYRSALLEREQAALAAKAALEERQKLARDLHDSVSQALYGISLGTQTAMDALARDQDIGAATEAIGYVLDQAEAGLTEMRALIFELRPESLQQEGLVAALERHAAVARARHGLAVALELGAEPDLSLEAKEVLHRIAVEALHNIVKHAQAGTVSVKLFGEDNSVVLEIADDGVGFDPHGTYPGHLGLISMRERAAGVGGEIIIRSTPRQGAALRVRLPV